MAEGPREISRSAFRRRQSLQKAYLSAAERMRAGDDYPDFFVEGSDPPWHERWPEAVSGDRSEFSEDRLLFVDRLAQDDYPDFFVEGSDPPRGTNDGRKPSGPENGSILPTCSTGSGLNVLEAFSRLSSRNQAE